MCFHRHLVGAFWVMLAVLIAIIVTVILLFQSEARGHSNGRVIPPKAAQYRPTAIREVRYYWGFGQSPSIFMAQIHQESGFREDAKSAFASGLTQFTPGTAEWIQKLYAKDLRETCPSKSGCPLNPRWAIRAMVMYDKRLWERYSDATGDERLGFMLASYNAGAGWITKEKLMATKMGVNSGTWFNSVETICARAKWACEESRNYVRRILFTLRHHYE